MRVCGYAGALSTEVKASPCVSQGLRSTQSLDLLSVCAAIPAMNMNPEGPSVSLIGAAPADHN